MMVAKADAASRLIDTARCAHARAVKQVKNGLKNLHARAKRSRSRATYIGVTGSSGKTTTANLLEHILSADFKVRTQADRNGFENASKALRQVTREDQFVVLEIGTSGPGLIERTTKLVRPDIAIVTMVAVEHYTAFRGIEAVGEGRACARIVRRWTGDPERGRPECPRHERFDKRAFCLVRDFRGRFPGHQPAHLRARQAGPDSHARPPEL
jgi:hypothetical protein